MDWFSEVSEGTVLSVRAKPRSSRAGVDGLFGDALSVRVRCAPVDGKANKELVATIADELDLPKSRVEFVSGETSKSKRILVKGLSSGEIRAKLGL